MKELKNGGLCNISGIYTAGLHIGFKYKNKDFALISIPESGTVSGLFTQNKVKAAPVLVSQKQLAEQIQYKAIAVTSGNANACTGQQGIDDVYLMQESIAGHLNIQPEEVLIASTGIIGKYLDLSFFDEGVEKAVQELSDKGSSDAAQAILTTDTKKKELAYEFDIGGQKGHIASITKGSGMIHPNLGTMISIVVTDINFGQEELHEILQQAADLSFNSMTIDGDTSTNDTLLLLSTNQVTIHKTEENVETFKQALTQICQENAQLIVGDGEGAHKFVTVNVEGAASNQDAVEVAKTVATSTLVKTALFGENPNWGRVISAVGNAKTEQLDPNTIDISSSNPSKTAIAVCRNSMPVTFDREEAVKILAEDDIIINIQLNLGTHQASVWTCDLSYDYIKINAEYS